MRRFKKLGAFLKKHRKAAGITQWDVAREMGYASPQFISNYERGLCAPARETLPLLMKLCKIKKLDMYELLLEIEKEQLCELLGIDLGE